jgi:hypothetical protein
MDLRISKLHVKYRWPKGSDHRERLNHVLSMMMAGPLERALVRAGMPESGLVCIRSLHASLRTHTGATDGAIAEAWAESVARQVKLQADRQDAREAILRRSAGASSFGGADLLPSPGRAEEDEPEIVRYRSRRAALLDMAVAVARGDLSRVWAWRQVGLWRGLGDESLAEAVRQLVAAWIEEPTAIASVVNAIDEIGLLRTLAQRIPGTDWMALARAAWEAAGYSARTLPLAGTTAAHHYSTYSGEALAFATSKPRSAPRQPEEWNKVSGPAQEALAVILQLGRHGRASAQPPSEPLPQFTEPGRPSQEKAQAGTAPVSTTRHAGLLFLLNLFSARDWFSELERDPRFAARPSRWVLHRMAMGLAEVPETDPAALAFCGLLPWQPPPTHSQPRPDETEREIVLEWRDRVRREVSLLLDPEQRRDPALVLAALLDRTARIDGDPGWIEVYLPFASVDLDLRRAGLDLDPGWLPAIGAVVRFVYE